MAQSQTTRVFSIKLEGIDLVVNSLDDAKVAVEELLKKQKQLEQELSNSDYNSESADMLAESLNKVKNEIVTLSNQIDKGTFSTLGEELQVVNNSLLETATNTDAVDTALQGTTNTVAGLKAELASTEEALENLAIGGEEFNKLNVRAKQIEKTLEFVNLSAEAVALGFVGIGKAGNSVEGLSVQMTALNAKLATLSDPLEKAEIDKQIEQIKIAIIETEAEAKKGLFPAGSLGALEAEMESLALKIKAVPAGSSEYNKLKKQLDETKIKTDFLSMSAVEQKQIFKDVGVSLASSFGTGAGLLASFGGESENVQKSLLILQQTMAVVDFIQQTSETLRQVRQAKAVAGLALQTTAQNANTASVIAGATAQGAANTATTAGTAATGGLGGAMKLLNGIIKANPIGAVLTALGILGGLVFALSSKFKFFGDIVNAVEDGFSGLVSVGTAVANNIGEISKKVFDVGKTIFELLPAVQIFKRTMNLFGAGFEVAEYGKSFEKLKNIALDGAEATAKAFKKGQDKSQALREIGRKEALNTATDSAAELAEAALGESNATASARRAIRVRELKEDRDLALQKIKIANDLSDAELAILRSGNEKKIAEIQKFRAGTGGLTEGATKILEDLTKVGSLEKSIIQENNAAFQEGIQMRIQAINDLTDLQIAKLGELNTFEKERTANALTLNKDLQTLAEQRRAGEFRTDTEYFSKKEAIEVKAQTATKELNRKESEFKRSLLDIDTNARIDTLKTELDVRRQTNETTFAEEKKSIEEINALRVSTLDREAATLDPKIPEQQKRLKEIEQEKLAIQREQTAELKDRQATIIQQELDRANRVIDLRQKELDNRKADEANAQAEADANNEKILANLDKQKARVITFNDAIKVQNQQYDISVQKLEKVNAQLTKEYNTTLDQIVLDEQRLALEEKSNAELLKAGSITQAEFDRRKTLNDEIRKGLSGQRVTAKIKLDTGLDQAKKTAEDEGEQLAMAYSDSIVKSLNSNQLTDQINKFLSDSFGAAGGKILSEFGAKIVEQFQALGSALGDAAIANIDKQIADLQEKSEKVQDEIAIVDEGISETQEKVSTLKGQLADARGAERVAINQQIDDQIARNGKLADSKAALASKTLNYAYQEEALEKRKKQLQVESARRQKAIAVAQAVINTALAIGNALATVPKVDFGVSTAVLVALYSVLGAAQVATIIAQPDPAEEGGFLGEGGGLLKFSRGGILKGKSHKQGGIRGTGKFGNVEVEGGEAIISKRVVAANPKLVGSLVAAGSPNVPNKRFEFGGMLPTESIYKSNPIKKFANGGFLPSPSGTSVEGLSNNTQAGIVEAISNVKINSFVSAVDITDAQNRVSVIDNGSGL